MVQPEKKKRTSSGGSKTFSNSRSKKKSSTAIQVYKTNKNSRNSSSSTSAPPTKGIEKTFHNLPIVKHVSSSSSHAPPEPAVTTTTSISALEEEEETMITTTTMTSGARSSSTDLMCDIAQDQSPQTPTSGALTVFSNNSGNNAQHLQLYQRTAVDKPHVKYSFVYRLINEVYNIKENMTQEQHRQFVFDTHIQKLRWKEQPEFGFINFLHPEFNKEEKLLEPAVFDGRVWYTCVCWAWDRNSGNCAPLSDRTPSMLCNALEFFETDADIETFGLLVRFSPDSQQQQQSQNNTNAAITDDDEEDVNNAESSGVVYVLIYPDYPQYSRAIDEYTYQLYLSRCLQYPMKAFYEAANAGYPSGCTYFEPWHLINQILHYCIKSEISTESNTQLLTSAKTNLSKSGGNNSNTNAVGLVCRFLFDLSENINHMQNYMMAFVEAQMNENIWMHNRFQTLDQNLSSTRSIVTHQNSNVLQALAQMKLSSNTGDGNLALLESSGLAAQKTLNTVNNLSTSSASASHKYDSALRQRDDLIKTFFYDGKMQLYLSLPFMPNVFLNIFYNALDPNCTENMYECVIQVTFSKPDFSYIVGENITSKLRPPAPSKFIQKFNIFMNPKFIQQYSQLAETFRAYIQRAMKITHQLIEKFKSKNNDASNAEFTTALPNEPASMHTLVNTINYYHSLIHKIYTVLDIIITKAQQQENLRQQKDWIGLEGRRQAAPFMVEVNLIFWISMHLQRLEHNGSYVLPFSDITEQNMSDYLKMPLEELIERYTGQLSQALIDSIEAYKSSPNSSSVKHQTSKNVYSLVAQQLKTFWFDTVNNICYEFTLLEHFGSWVVRVYTNKGSKTNILESKETLKLKEIYHNKHLYQEFSITELLNIGWVTLDQLSTLEGNRQICDNYLLGGQSVPRIFGPEGTLQLTNTSGSVDNDGSNNNASPTLDENSPNLPLDENERLYDPDYLNYVLSLPMEYVQSL